MKSTILKSTIGVIGAVLLLGSTLAYADETADLATLTKACNQGWAQSSTGTMGADAKTFGANFCDCFTGKYYDYMKSNNNQKPPTDDKDKMSNTCVSKTLVNKTADSLENADDVDAAKVEKSCKDVYTTVQTQLGGTPTLSDTTTKFCGCVSPDLASAISGNLSDDDFAKKIDEVVNKCGASV